MSPPPIIINLFKLCKHFAIFFVPFSKALFSKTPKGPFQKIDFAFFKCDLNKSIDSGPMSNPILLLGILVA